MSLHIEQFENEVQKIGGIIMTNKIQSIQEDEIMVGDGVKFEKIRRITGYLVGTLDRFNDGKKAEESDRVKHGL